MPTYFVVKGGFKMGTNFYYILHPFLSKEWAESVTDTNPKKHIGKRSYIGEGKTPCTLR